MSRFSPPIQIQPGENITPTKLNSMVGSTSTLRTFINGGNLNWMNFKPNAGIKLNQKTTSTHEMTIPFMVGGTLTVGAGTTLTWDLVVWEPKLGARATLRGTAGVTLDNYTRAITTSGTITVYKQSQRNALVSLGSENIMAAAGPQTIDLAAPNGEDLNLLPEKGERVIVRLAIDAAGGASTLTALIGTLRLKHTHVRRND